MCCNININVLNSVFTFLAGLSGSVSADPVLNDCVNSGRVLYIFSTITTSTENGLKRLHGQRKTDWRVKDH